LTKLFKAGKDPSNISVEELKSEAENVIRTENVNQMLKDSKNEYKEAYKSGKVSGKESVTLEDE